MMFEVALLYDLDRDVDPKAYAEWAKKVIGHVLRSPGLIEFRAHRNLLGSPQIRSTTVWGSLADWQDFSQSEAWQAAEAELRGTFASVLRVELWGPSPMVPEPLKPGK